MFANAGRARVTLVRVTRVRPRPPHSMGGGVATQLAARASTGTIAAVVNKQSFSSLCLEAHAMLGSILDQLAGQVGPRFRAASQISNQTALQPWLR